MGRQPENSEAGKQILARIRKIKPFLEGSMTTTKKRCGSSGCRCVKVGPIHEVTLLTWKKDQKTRTLYVPKSLQKEVTEWLDQMKILRRLIHEMSEAQRKFLVAQKKKKSRSH